MIASTKFQAIPTLLSAPIACLIGNRARTGLISSFCSNKAHNYRARCLHVTRSSAIPVKPRFITSDLERPVTDTREYRVIELSNGLEVLLIHDKTTEKSSAALDVNIGSFQDPKDLPGLAHFCEHLLFMGTKKYPQENEYSRYLSEHSGHSNAYTSSEHTNYYFEVGHEHFNGAIDRFAQFFIDPLFSADCKEREINAVDSENQKNIQNDTWRLNQLQKSLANPDHPYCRFSTGNLETLGTIPESLGMDVREKLLDFYNESYSSNLMKLVVLGRESLDILQELVNKTFVNINNKNKKHSYSGIQPFAGEQLKNLVRAKPVMDFKVLKINFVIPDQTLDYETKASYYYSHLIGHESEGSLFHYFKTIGWVAHLSAGSTHIGGGGNDLFSINLDLTEEGLKNYENILVNIFEYLEMLKTENYPAKEWIFQELKHVGDANFRFSQKGNVSNTSSQLASIMHQKNIPREQLLSSSLLRKFDHKMLDKFLQHLNSDNFFVTLIARDLPGFDQREKWYGTEYSVQNLESNLMSRISSCKPSNKFSLPEVNKFIPTDFEVKDFPEDKENFVSLKRPNLVDYSLNRNTWHKKDDLFGVPKAFITISLDIPGAHSTALNSIKSSLLTALINDDLNTLTYDAQIAGLGYSISSSRRGMTISLNGYNDKMIVLLQELLNRIVTHKVKENRFLIIKEKFLENFKNFGLTTPYNQVGQYSTYLLNENIWLVGESELALEATGFEDIVSFNSDYFRNVSVKTLVHGNLNELEAQNISSLIETFVAPDGSLKEACRMNRSLDIVRGSVNHFNFVLEDEKNVSNCIDYLLKLGPLHDKRLRVLAELLSQVGSEPAFNQLRTKEQLGYIVFSGLKTTRTTAFYRVLVQSERDPYYLEQRIDHFLKKFRIILAEMKPVEFLKHVDSLVSKKLEKFKNLNEEHGLFWSHIQSGRYEFSQHETDAQELQSVTQEELVKFFDEYISTESAARTKLVINLHSKAQKVLPAPDLFKSTVTTFLSDNDIFVTEATENECVQILSKKFSETSKSDIEHMLPEIVDQMFTDLGELQNSVVTKSAFVKYLGDSLLLHPGLKVENLKETSVESLSLLKSTLVFSELPERLENLENFMK